MGVSLGPRGWIGAGVAPTCTGVALPCNGIALPWPGVALLQCWSRLVGFVLLEVVLEAQVLQRCPKFHLIQLQLRVCGALGFVDEVLRALAGSVFFGAAAVALLAEVSLVAPAVCGHYNRKTRWQRKL